MSTPHKPPRYAMEDLNGTFFCAAISGTGTLSAEGAKKGAWHWNDSYGNDWKNLALTGLSRPHTSLENGTAGQVLTIERDKSGCVVGVDMSGYYKWTRKGGPGPVPPGGKLPFNTVPQGAVALLRRRKARVAMVAKLHPISTSPDSQLSAYPRSPKP